MFQGLGLRDETMIKRIGFRKGDIMDEKKFKKIIQFAIDKEIRAFDFYTHASQM
jgi:rubrerythrin